MDSIDVLGIGFGCIDLIFLDKADGYSDPLLMNGGTCLNVLTVLAQLGANVKMYMAGTQIDSMYNLFIKNCKDLGVDVRFMNIGENILPRCIQVNSDGNHRFEQTCPVCNSRLKYVVWGKNAKDIEQIIGEPVATVLFIDRITEGIKTMVQKYYDNQSIVFYEPNSGRNMKSITEMSAFCDIIKFSFSRITKKSANKIFDYSSNGNLKLVIATKGKNGLEYRYRRTNKELFSEWIEVKPNNIVNGGDSSGSGDWMTAGFINKFILMNRADVEYTSDNIERALYYAMGLSEYANLTIGAQGAFYNKSLITKLRKDYQIKKDKPIEYSSINIDYPLFKKCFLCGQLIRENPNI